MEVVARLKNMPRPVMMRALDEVTRVRLSHLGVVSRRLCLAGSVSLVLLFLQFGG